MRRASSEIWNVVEPVVHAMGYEFVGATFGGRAGDRILRVYIDAGEGVTIDDCEAVSRQLSAMLDVEDPVGEAYVLEVSSPGIDRPLLRETDYQRFTGEQAFIRLFDAVDGRRRFKGVLGGVEDRALLIEVDGRTWRLPLAAVEEAHLVGRL